MYSEQRQFIRSVLAGDRCLSPATVYDALSARVAEHRPAAQLSFEQARASIENRLRRDEATKLAQKEGAEKLAQLKAGGVAGLKWSPVRMVSRHSPQGLSAEALRQVMAADASKLPVYVGANSDAGYSIYRIARILDAEARTDEQKKAAVARYVSQVGAQQHQAYLASLRSRAKMVVNKSNLEKKQP